MADIMNRDGFRSRIKRGIGAAVFCHTTLTIIQLMLVPVFAHYLGAHKYGIWLMIATLPTYIGLGDLGFGVTSATVMSFKSATGDLEGARVTLQTTFSIITSFCITIVALCFFLEFTMFDRMFPHGGAQFTQDAKSALSILILYGGVCLNAGICHGALRANGDFAWSPMITAISQIVEAVAGIFSVVTFGSLTSVAVAYLCTRLITVLGTFAFVQRRVPWVRWSFANASIVEARSLASPAIAMLAMPFAQSLFIQGTALAVGLGSTPEAVASFSSVRTLTRAGLQASLLVGQPAVPEFSAAMGRGDREQAARIFLLNTGSALAIAAPATIVLLTFGVKIIQLWTRGAVSATWNLIAIMTIVMCLGAVWNPVSKLIIAMNEQRRFTYIYLGATSVGVFIAYFCSLAFGALGGAFSMVLVDLTMVCVVGCIANKLLFDVRTIVKKLSGAALARRLA